MTLELPAALAPWAPLLSIFPRDIALSLAPWLQKLAIGIGPMRGHGARPRHEPTGYDGLARRGNYDRLLASEWLLAGEMPDEFIRRAAMNEHLFFRLATHESAAARRCVVLFDEGPSQLGTPRVAHVALLIVLARRAQAAHADFNWGVLQAPDATLAAEPNEENIRSLLHARTAFEATEEHARAWKDTLGVRNETEERWVVGGERAARLARELAATAIRIEDLIEPEVRQLVVRPSAARESAAEIRLDLPDQPTCIRLLRDPFSATAAKPQWIPGTVSRNPRLVFGQWGRRIAIISSRDRILARSVPNSPRAPAAPGFQFAVPKKEFLAAVGWSPKGKLIVVTGRDDRSLVVQELGRRGGLAGTRIFEDLLITPFQAPEADDPVSACFRIGGTQGDMFVLGDATGMLFMLGLNPGDPTIWLTGENVSAYGETVNGAAYVTRGFSGHRPRLVAISRSGDTTDVLDLVCEGNLDAFFGHGGSHAQVGLVAIHKRPGRWLVMSGGNHELCPPEGHTVCGVMCPPGYAGEPALLVREPDQRTLSLLGRRINLALPRSVDPIVYACASSCSPHIGYVTASGEVVIYSVAHKNIVLHLTPTGET